MSFLETRQQSVSTDQRRSARLMVAIPVTFRTASGDRQCHMANISDQGAKLETESPPGQGVSGMLIMGKEEVYCTVIWSNEAACGIEFERCIDDTKLVEIAGEQMHKGGPAANTGKIKMGRKRGSLVSG